MMTNSIAVICITIPTENVDDRQFHNGRSKHKFQTENLKTLHKLLQIRKIHTVVVIQNVLFRFVLLIMKLKL